MIYEIRFWRSLLFNEHAMIGIRTTASVTRAWIYFALAVLFQVLPVSMADVLRLHIDIPKIAILYFILVALGAGVSIWLGSRMPFYKFLYTSSTIMAFGGFFMAVLTYLSVFVFERLFDTAVVSNVVLSLIPFYYIVLFGYSIDVASNLDKNWKRILIAIVAITAMYGAYFFL